VGGLIRGYENDAILIDRPGIRGFFLITDADRGMFAIQEESAKDYTVERCKELIIIGIGKPDLPVEIVEIAHWQPGQLVAEHFGQGRVFLVGDAAHTMPPKLGLGCHTAIQSAQNLAWKLAGRAATPLARTIFSGAIEHNASPLPDAIRARHKGLSAARGANQALRTARRHNTSIRRRWRSPSAHGPRRNIPVGSLHWNGVRSAGPAPRERRGTDRARKPGYRTELGR